MSEKSQPKSELETVNKDEVLFYNDEKKRAALKQAYFTGDFKTMSNMITATSGKHQATVQGVDYNLLSARLCAMVRYCL